jgi:putative glutathione S-transferase
MLATHPDPVPAFRGRIGQDPRSGYHAVPHRYRLYLTPSCPECLRIAVTHDLLGIGDTLPVTLLPALPDTADGGHGALRPLYEAGSHRHSGPALAPVLGDDWTGRIVSTHAPDILRDLARWFGGPGAALRPCEAQEETETVDRLCERGVTASAHRAGRADADAETRDAALTDLLTALDGLERRLAGRAYVLGCGGGPTAADVQVWVTLVWLDTVHGRHLDGAAARRIAAHTRLWDYARRLTAHPAFGRHLDLDAITRRHRAECGNTGVCAGAPKITQRAA